VYQQLTQLGRTDSAVGAPKFTKVQIFPAALHARPGGLVYIFDVYGFAHPFKTSTVILPQGSALGPGAYFICDLQRGCGRQSG